MRLPTHLRIMASFIDASMASSSVFTTSLLTSSWLFSWSSAERRRMTRHSSSVAGRPHPAVHSAQAMSRQRTPGADALRIPREKSVRFTRRRTFADERQRHKSADFWTPLTHLLTCQV